MNKLKFLSIFLAFGSLASIALADSDVVKTAKAYYAKEASLYKKKDAAGLKKLVMDTTTADFVSTLSDGQGHVLKMTRNQAMEALTSVLPKVRSIILGPPTFAATSISKSTATLTFSSTTQVTTLKGPDGKSHNLSLTTKKEETWVKIQGTWKLKGSRQLSVRRALDGKSEKS